MKTVKGARLLVTLSAADRANLTKLTALTGCVSAQAQIVDLLQRAFAIAGLKKPNPLDAAFNQAVQSRVAPDASATELRAAKKQAEIAGQYKTSVHGWLLPEDGSEPEFFKRADCFIENMAKFIFPARYGRPVLYITGEEFPFQYHMPRGEGGRVDLEFIDALMDYDTDAYAILNGAISACNKGLPLHFESNEDVNQVLKALDAVL